MYRLIDGTAVAEEIKASLKKEISNIKERGDRAPGLAVILVGNDPYSEVYVNLKVSTCLNLGIRSEKHLLDSKITEGELINLIKQLNNNDSIDGILIQFPLPSHLNANVVIDAVDPKKDVDGLTAISIGNMFSQKDSSYMFSDNYKYFCPCTPLGVMSLFTKYNIDLKGKKAVVVGRSNIVGKPLAIMLIQAGATVTIAHSQTLELQSITREADILVVAAGRPCLITADMVKDKAVVIDVGRCKVNNKTVGDVEFENVKEKAAFITPVLGGVGPMTIAMLMSNTMKAYRNNNKTKM